MVLLSFKSSVLWKHSACCCSTLGCLSRSWNPVVVGMGLELTGGSSLDSVLDLVRTDMKLDLESCLIGIGVGVLVLESLVGELVWATYNGIWSILHNHFVIVGSINWKLNTYLFNNGKLIESLNLSIQTRVGATHHTMVQADTLVSVQIIAELVMVFAATLVQTISHLLSLSLTW